MINHDKKVLADGKLEGMTKFLAEKLNSQEHSIRIAAIKVLMRHQSPEHLEIIKKQASQLNSLGKLAKSDAIWTSLALARLIQLQWVQTFGSVYLYLSVI